MANRESIKSALELVSSKLPNDATLVAVTKYSSIEDIVNCYELGHRDFGENRVSDLTDKAFAFADQGLDSVKWHFIGNLQSNKVSKLLKIPNLSSIHSVDSLSLLQNLYKKEDLLLGESLDIFLQVNTSDESEKSGFSTYDELMGCVNLCLKNQDSKIKLRGLMTMGKIRTDNFEGDANKSFKSLRSFRDQLLRDFPLKKLGLSMGMSSDFEIALEHGATHIRVGSTIFK